MNALIFFLAVLAAIVFILLYVKNLLVSALLGFIIFYLLNPLANWLQTKGFSRLKATALPFFLLSVFAIIGILFVLPVIADQVGSLQRDFPQYVEGSAALLAKVQNFLSEYISQDLIQLVISKVQAFSTELAQGILAAIPAMISNSLTVLIMAPFIGFFMLLDAGKWSEGALVYAPAKHKRLIEDVIAQISEQMGGFIRARIIETFALCVFITIGLLIMDFPYALLLGILGGLLNLIPYVGPIISAIPAFMIALIHNADASTYWWLTGIYVGSQVLDGAILVPFLVAKIVNLHPLIVVISVMMGAQLMGVLGMIIAIPVCSVLKLVIATIHAKIQEEA